MLIPQTFLFAAVLWSLSVSPVCIQHCIHKGDWYVLSCCRLFLTCFEEIALAQVDMGLFAGSFQLGESKFSNTNMTVSANQIKGSSKDQMDSIASAKKYAEQVSKVC